MSEIKYKLTYFNVRGRAEVIRLILRAASVPFEDVRIENEDWLALKPNTPFGSLPVLEVEGNIYAQSCAIAVYLAKEYDLYGSNNLERLAIDQMMYLRNDLMEQEGKVAFGSKDDQERAAGMRSLRDEIYPKFFAQLVNMIHQNQEKTHSSFAVGNKLSLADLLIHEGTQSATQTTTCIHAFPELKKVREAVESMPALKEYLANRPSYPL